MTSIKDFLNQLQQKSFGTLSIDDLSNSNESVHAKYFLSNSSSMFSALLRLYGKSSSGTSLNFNDLLGSNENMYNKYMTQPPPANQSYAMGLKTKLTGSAFDFNIQIFPPDNYPEFHSSSAGLGLLSDLCAYTQGTSDQVIGKFFLNDYTSDIFVCDDATVLNALEEVSNAGLYVVISCDSAQALTLNDVYGDFEFVFTPQPSDQILMHYTDNNCDTSHLFSQEIRFSVDIAREPLTVYDFSSCSDRITVEAPNFIDCALVCVDAHSPIEQIDTIECIPLKSSNIQDPTELCDLVHCACDMEAFLRCQFSDISDRINHRCCVTYNGPVNAKRVRYDLENCRIFFEDFYIPECSDLPVR